MKTVDPLTNINRRNVMIDDPDTGERIRRIDWIRRVYSDLKHPLFGDRAAIARKLSEIEGREVLFQTIYSATRHLGGKSSTMKQARIKEAFEPSRTKDTKVREAYLKRTTSETDIEMRINLDGTGQADVSTGVGFFDHMLTLLACHGRMDIELQAKGDLPVDYHHTVEDCGLVLGQLVAEALGDKRGINRYADYLIPMDEALVRVALDISGRPHLTFNVDFSAQKIGTFDSELVAEWFHAFAMKAGLTLHVDLIRGHNSHHIAEACFKGLARTLHSAAARNVDLLDVIPSSKGTLS